MSGRSGMTRRLGRGLPGPNHACTHDGAWAALPAAVLSGLPSTVYALLTGRDVLEAAAAAGAVVAPRERRRARLIVYAVPVHAAISLFWSVVLARVLPSTSTLLFGIAGGGAIATLDLGVFGRRVPAVRSLRQGPQVVDHLAFGAVVGAVVASRRARRRAVGRAPLHVIAANRVVHATPEKVFDFLSVLEHHWVLTGNFAQVVELPDREGAEAAGKVRIRGWFGLRRTVRTRLSSIKPPSQLTGEACVGRRTRASLTWILTERGDQTDVVLRAEIDDAGWLDQALLSFGGWWLDRNFDRVLEQLDDTVSRR